MIKKISQILSLKIHVQSFIIIGNMDGRMVGARYPSPTHPGSLLGMAAIRICLKEAQGIPAKIFVDFQQLVVSKSWGSSLAICGILNVRKRYLSYFGIKLKG